MDSRPLIGVAVIVLRENKVLLGKRAASHGTGTWAFPGGHLEFGESIVSCAQRELFEETGLLLKNARFGPFTNDIFSDENKHYVTLFVVGNCDDSKPFLKEPEKCEMWDWFAWDRLPEPRFLPFENLLASGFDPVDITLYCSDT